MAKSSDAGRRRQERNAFVLVAVVLFPALAVGTVAAYGFAVWIWQMFSGPPTG